MSIVHVLFNPFAGNGRGEESARKVAAFLPEDDLRFQSMTEIEDYASFLAAIPAEEILVICGGDGTLNRFVNDTAGLTIPNPVYYYACGSGNDFLHDLGKEPETAPFEITQYLKDLPTVTVQGKSYRFLNGVGYGIDGYCCEVGDKLRETTDKPVNYAGIAIKGLLFYYKPTNATVTVDGVAHTYRKVWLAPTMHGRFYGGGMMPTPAQDRLDPEGKLSVLVWHGSGKIPTLANFPGIFKGEHLKKAKMCEVFTGKEITVTFDAPVACQIDGETILGVTEYTAKSAL